MNRKTKKAALPLSTGTVADYRAINAALETTLELTWTAENQAELKTKVGPENFCRIQEIVAFTSNQDVWLTDASLSAAADRVAGRLGHRFPFLSANAIFKLVNQGTYGWH